jgi:enoyl-[acyl-carrier-protein] reductase (NADH)
MPVMDVGSSHKAVIQGVNKLATVPGYGATHVLVHALSGASIGNILGTQPQQVEKTFNCLANSFLWWVQELLASGMLMPNASIIGLTSPCSDFYLRNSGVIGPAKAALEAYVKSLAVEIGPMGFRVNALKFGTILTPALEKVLGDATANLKELYTHIMPDRRMQTADEIADYVYMLTRPEMKGVNGAILDVTGGQTLKLMDYAFHSSR